MRILRRGSRGNDVAEVQVRLSELGYIPGPIDGIFGAKTEAAVIRFQRDRGLTPDGIVGPLTYNVLFQPVPQPDYIPYTIKAGDTLYKLSLIYGVSVDELFAANPGVDPYQLRIGQQIIIPKRPGRRHTFSAWIPYWVQQEAMAVVRQHAELFTTLSPFWYELTPTGDLLLYPNGEDSALIEFTLSRGIELIPLIANNYDQQLISTVLNNPTIRQRHVTQIVNKVLSMNYAGIEIDYENIAVTDRDLFVLFLRELKTALVPYDKKLYVAIQAKTYADEPVSAGHDYLGIGSIVDVVRLMLYDYSWDTPGSIAPVGWIQEVLDYAVTVIPSSKLEAGLPTYGYDWGTTRRGVTYDVAIRLAQQYGAQIIQDPQGGPHFSYIDADEIVHEVWFINAIYFATFVDIVNQYTIRGISIWYPGGDDPQIYTVIRDRLM
ncbi:MAG TPA: LysM peptidoglycan-binding domain-containing protein [Desulfitobacterium dehalogenans]|uniref:LysM peptidoglycan-binding domain-containing protein n=1 Tax=Desulfitobacterium dehalogenans TaxID=36854 RepID=A0A7C6Z489_9FIRM|nr:LysM peptidoglycan-binding domain-containing protein [Desulfitobacterium dehalogenans]